MLDRKTILDTIDAGYAARAAENKAALEDFWAPGATFQLVGEATLLPTFPVGPLSGAEATPRIIDLISFQSHERVAALVEGNRAAILWKVTMSSATNGPHETMLYDLWEFEESGKPCSLIQFADTALVAAMIAAE